MIRGILAVTALSVLVPGCAASSGDSDSYEAIRGADGVSITYVRDERPVPSVCYAFYSHTHRNEGGLATVDCDAVHHLVTKVIVEKGMEK